MKSVDTILFDWDGTLIDTAPYAFDAFRKALYDLGIPIQPEQYESVYAPNWYGMYRALGVPEPLWEKADDLWMHYYAGSSAPLVAEGLFTLQELKRRGYCLGVVTSGSHVRVKREIAGFGLSDVFRTVVCNEDVVNKKPHPEGLHTAMQHLAKTPEACCYVGDSPDDIAMGKSARVRTIGVPSGYPSSKKITEAKPDYCFDSIVQLLAHLGGLKPASGSAAVSAA